MTRILRYGVVGLLGAALYLGTTTFLVSVMGWSPVVSSIIGFLLSVLEGYTLNYFWTFQSEKSHVIAAFRFLMVSCVGLLLNVGVMYVGVTVWGGDYVMVAMIVMALVPISNYLMNAHWTFRQAQFEVRMSRQCR